ncbi:MAG: isocitrate lyase/phosphoenolpyruvate mutase family protein [SAR324 cluster bacterium]|nr:isocitrate lyase/phosphoenolpyruvate mutase family protein [SAR324 cluster bacterium]
MHMPITSNSITECVRIAGQKERRACGFENILAGRIAPAETPEQRFLEFRFPTEHPSTLLRRLLQEQAYVFAPGLYNAGGMKLAAHAGFKAAYLSGYSYAVEEHGLTDVGAFSRTELAEQARRMVRACDYWLREQYVDEGVLMRRLPLVMDLEDGHGGFGQVQNFMQQIVSAGVAAGHLEDQAERRCGHLPGKVLVSVEKQIERLLAARSEADQIGVDDFVLIARTDAATARHTPEGVPGSIDLAVERTLAYARAEIHNRRAIDLAWCEFKDQAWEAIVYWARRVRSEHPDLPLAINLSSSFDWTNPEFLPLFSMEQLAEEGFQYMFMTLADNHAGRNGSWEFFKDIQRRGTAAFIDMQRREQASGTPSQSHNKLAGTSTYFVGGTVFGSLSFATGDERATDADLSGVVR